MAVVEVMIQQPAYDEDGYWWETVLLRVAGAPAGCWAVDSDDIEDWSATDPPEMIAEALRWP